MERKLVIDCLGYVHNRAFGFNEFLFNLLDYFYSNRELIDYDLIIIACQKSQSESFDKYKDKFAIKSSRMAEKYMGRLLAMSLLPFWLCLSRKDTILSPGNYSGLIKRCHQVLVIHDLLYRRPDLLRNPAMQRQREFFVPRSVELADRVIGISEFTAKEIKETFPKYSQKVLPIYNYMNFGKYGLPYTALEDDNYFLTITNAWHKDWATLFRAYDAYIKAGGTKKLVAVGRIEQNTFSQEAYDAMSEKAKSMVVAKRAISNEEMGNLYRHASCYISTSLFEGFGMPIAEAMFFGLPVFLADIGIHREISMGYGEYFAPYDDAALANLMQNYNYARNNYQEIVSVKYDAEHTSKKYVDVLNCVDDNQNVIVNRGG